MLAKGLKRRKHVVRLSLRGQTNIEHAESSKVGGEGRRGMLGGHLAEGLVRVNKACARQSLAGLSVSPLPAKIRTPLLLESFFKNRCRHRPPSLFLLVGREALPQGAPLSVQPSLRPSPSEGDALRSVLFTSTGWGAQDAFGKHLQLQPVLHIIVVSSSSQGARQTLSP